MPEDTEEKLREAGKVKECVRMDFTEGTPWSKCRNPAVYGEVLCVKHGKNEGK